MGAEAFIVTAHGANANKAFNAAVADARYEDGSGGYSGTLAEKDAFIEIPLPKGADPVKEANRMIDEDDARISNKWGPAGCFNLGSGRYLFFGWASS